MFYLCFNFNHAFAQDVVAPQMIPAPVQGSIASPFGWRVDPITGQSRFHSGLDIAAPTGSPVFALQPGWVVFSGNYGGYGNLVVLQHAEGLHTWYGHNSVLLKQTGEWVNPGDIISLVGATGRATGPHLHFEVRIRGEAVDPTQYLAGINLDPLARIAQTAPIKQNHAKVTTQAVASSLPAKRYYQQPETQIIQRGMGAPTPGDRTWTVELVNGQKAEQHIFLSPNRL